MTAADAVTVIVTLIVVGTATAVVFYMWLRG